MKTKTRYSEFADQIDVDAFMEAIGFDPTESKDDNEIGQCPDIWGMHKHGDTTGKFAIHREKRVYHCFVCGGGSLLSLAMEFFDMEVDEATDWMRQFTRGDMRSDAEFYDEMMKLLDKYHEVKAEKMPYFNDHVLGRFNDKTKWFKQRGIADWVVEKYKLGYGNYVMKPAPIKGGEKIDDDYYGPCAVFPHFWEGTLVGWQHRWMAYPNTPKWLAKYTNTSDFPKAETLFNYDIALLYPEPVIVCESVPTVLFLQSHGIPAVAFFGGGIKEQQLRLLRRFGSGVILAPDNDAPGEKFVHTASKYLERYVDVKILPPVTESEGADLGDYAHGERIKALEEHLNLAYRYDFLNGNPSSSTSRR